MSNAVQASPRTTFSFANCSSASESAYRESATYRLFATRVERKDAPIVIAAAPSSGLRPAGQATATAFIVGRHGPAATSWYRWPGDAAGEAIDLVSLANTEAAAALQSFQAPLRPRLLATGASDARWAELRRASLQRDLG